MQVSFIIPLYNCLPFTQAMFASLQATMPTGLEHEIIFVDDGSTDGTRAWLRTLPGGTVRVVLNEQNSGYATANNRGAAIAKGRFLVLLNNDLVLRPRWLEPMLEARDVASRAGIIGNVQREAKTGEIDHAGIIVNDRGKPEHLRTLGRRWWNGNPVQRRPAVTGACLLLERALWEQLGGFDEEFVNGGEDVDLCFRARQLDRETYVVLNSIIDHHVSSSVGRKRRDEENSYRLARKWRREFEREGIPAWCREYLRTSAAWPRATEFDLVFRAAAYLAGVDSVPPLEAFAGVKAALDREFARWEAMFPSVPANRGVPVG